nr:hypothetical protein [uncultured bacterium]
MQIRLIFAMFALTGVVCLADDAADRNKLAGTWNLNGAAGNISWTVRGNENGSVHLTYTRGTEKLADFECNTEGKDCSVRMEGHPVKVSLYFNGPRLVMLETRGDTVVKWRFGVVSDSGEMEVESMPITPAGKAETLRFKHAEVQASSR